MSRVAVIGAGYVGLATTVTLTHLGHEVRCAEINPDRLATLRDGRSPLLEPGLETMLRDAFDRELLEFVPDAPTAAADAEFVFLCVQTPMGQDGHADLSFVEAATSEVADVMPSGSVLIVKSTVPIGTSRVVGRALQREDVAVVSSPEFLQEGMAVHDSLHPHRIVIGTTDQAAAIRVDALFEGINAPRLVTDPASAEATKYAANSFLATKISFINAVAALCEEVGADLGDVALGMGYDPRIGFEYLKPGPGFGGSCLPKDVRALRAMSLENGFDFSLLDAVMALNERQFSRIADKVRAMAGGDLEGVTIAVWGLAFKARTNDIRDSPALAVIARLRRLGATIRAFDPAVPEPIDGVESCDDAYAACEGASVLVVLTEWDEFRWLDFEKVGGAMAKRAIVDTRNLLEPAALRRLGFAYEGIGR